MKKQIGKSDFEDLKKTALAHKTLDETEAEKMAVDTTGLTEKLIEEEIIKETPAVQDAVVIEENIIINIEDDNDAISSIDEAPVASAAAAAEEAKKEESIEDLLDPVLVARYLLGFQIKQHLLTNEYCCVYCEL